MSKRYCYSFDHRDKVPYGLNNFEVVVAGSLELASYDNLELVVLAVDTAVAESVGDFSVERGWNYYRFLDFGELAVEFAWVFQNLVCF